MVLQRRRTRRYECTAGLGKSFILVGGRAIGPCGEKARGGVSPTDSGRGAGRRRKGGGGGFRPHGGRGVGGGKRGGEKGAEGTAVWGGRLEARGVRGGGRRGGVGVHSLAAPGGPRRGRGGLSSARCGDRGTRQACFWRRSAARVRRAFSSRGSLADLICRPRDVWREGYRALWEKGEAMSVIREVPTASPERSARWLRSFGASQRS